MRFQCVAAMVVLCTVGAAGQTCYCQGGYTNCGECYYRDWSPHWCRHSCLPGRCTDDGSCGQCDSGFSWRFGWGLWGCYATTWNDYSDGPYPSRDLRCDSGVFTGAISTGRHLFGLSVRSTRPYTFSLRAGLDNAVAWPYGNFTSFNSHIRIRVNGEWVTSDDSCGLQESELTVMLEPGRYSVFVEGSNCNATHQTDVYRVSASCGNAPSSGNLTCGGSVAGDTTGAVSVVGAAAGEHYYRLSVPVAMGYVFSACDGSSINAQLKLYTGDQTLSTELVPIQIQAGCRIERWLEPGMYTVVVEGADMVNWIHPDDDFDDDANWYDDGEDDEYFSNDWLAPGQGTEGAYTLTTSCTATWAPSMSPTASPAHLWRTLAGQYCASGPTAVRLDRSFTGSDTGAAHTMHPLAAETPVAGE